MALTSQVLQKVGPDKTIGELRALNEHLRRSGVRYGSEVADAAEESLNVLERSLANLKGDERLGALWGWYSTLEKSNPTLAAAVLKTWLETLPGMKWASVLMSKGSSAGVSGGSSSDDSKGRGNGDNGGGGRSGSGGGNSSTTEAADGEIASRASSVLEAIRSTHPGVFDKYHVVLIPREDAIVERRDRGGAQLSHPGETHTPMQ